MLQIRARSLGSAMIAAALMTAVAVPAVAAPAADTDPTDPAKTVATPGPGDSFDDDIFGDDKDDKQSDEKNDDGRKKDEGKKDDGKKDDEKKHDGKKDDDKKYDGKKDDHSKHDGKKDDDKKGHDKKDKFGYLIKVTPKKVSSAAEGEFSVDRRGARHQGWVRDKGKGFTVVTFRHFDRHHDDAKIKVFKVQEGKKWTGFEKHGHFKKISVSVCKVFPKGHKRFIHICKTKIFSKSWH
jgi:hypothetical protein